MHMYIYIYVYVYIGNMMINHIKPSKFAERICAEKCRTTHHFMGFYVWHFMASLRGEISDIGSPIFGHQRCLE